MSRLLSELAQLTATELVGDADVSIECISDISTAVTGSITFVSDLKYKKYLQTTAASAVIITPDLLAGCSKPALISNNPRLTYARIANILYPAESWQPGIAQTAVVSESASVSASARIESGAVIGDHAVVGDGSYIGPNAVIEQHAIIGNATVIRSNAVIGHHCTVGNHCVIHACAVLGADGFGFVRDVKENGEIENIKIPQIAAVVIGDNTEIGASATVDRGALDDTVIGNGVKLDDQVHVAHGVSIGDGTIISGCTGISGSTRIGSGCLVGGNVGISDHLEIADNVTITGRTLVTHSITKPGTSWSSSTPMDETAAWRKNSVRFRQLDKLARRVNELEKKLEKLNKKQ